MIKFIVERLKEKPFNISVRAVDFDDKHPGELLQILNDVLGSLKTELKADLRTTSRDEVVEKMCHFLVTHKCTCIPDLIDGFSKKQSLYQMLHWVLSNYENLQTQEYLADFLTPIEIPSELFVQKDRNLRELFDAYKLLQTNFNRIHEQFTVTNAFCSKADIKESIAQLEAEKKQLEHRLQQEQVKIGSNPDFQRFLVQSGEMRQAQDNELRLERQKEEQLLSLTFAKQRLKQVMQLLKVIDSCQKMTIDSIIDEINLKYREAVHQLEVNIIPERQTAEIMLLQAKNKSEADAAKENIFSCEDKITEMNVLLHQRRAELEKKLLSDPTQGRDKKIEVLKLELNDATENLHKLYKQMAESMLLKELLVSKNDELIESIKSLDSEAMNQRSEGRSISITDIAELKTNISKKTELCNNLKLEIMAIQESLSALQKTKDNLTNQLLEVVSHREQEERIAEVNNFNDVNSKLIVTSQETASLNVLKTEALGDISDIALEIAQTLDEKQHELKPKIETLKIRRKEVHDLQQVHDQYAQKYYETWSTLSKDIQELETDCSRLRQQWLTNYQLLGLKDESSIAMHSSLEKDRRTVQKKLSTKYITNQKTMFENLQRLLEFHSNLC